MIAGGTNDPTTSVRRRRSNPRAASATSRRSPMSSAAAVPACRATSKALRSSPSSDTYGQPSSHGTSVVCAEEEIGSSSAGPCRAPSASAWRTGSASSGGGIERARPAPAHERVGDADDDQREHRVVDVVQGVPPFLPARADLLADEDEAEDPG